MSPERTVAEPRLELPADLMMELKRRGAAPRTDMHVEGWKPSLLGRFLGLFGGKRSG
jgi:hypothetical protein